MFDKLNKLAGREKAGLVVAVLCILGVLVDRLVVASVAEAIRGVGADLERQAMELEYDRSVLGTRDAVTKQYELAQGMLRRSSGVSEAIDLMKGEIDEMARKSGLILISMEHREPRHSGGLTEYIVDIGSFECGMENLVRFLHEVETAPGMPRVTQVRISGDERRGALKGAARITKVTIGGE